METIVNTTVKTINTLKLKEDIKVLANEQKFYRNQRKEVHIVGERKMPASTAASEHRYNRQKLRIMYAAYGIARGKTFNQIESHYQLENHPLKEHQFSIDKLLKTYEIQTKGE